jgi:hypothetical protein
VIPALLLACSAVLAADTLTVRGDSTTYATPELRHLVEEAAELNHRVPIALGGYRAQLESEISIGNRRSEGMEMSVLLEQVASTLEWDRSGTYQQTITGYRSQSIGASFATIGFFRNGWAIPSLYGNRLALLFGRDTSETARRRRQRRGGDPLYAIHPLADDRESYYTYSGGDTIVTMTVGDREIPIVRIDVALRPDVPARSVVFLGELDLDASRRHIVRLRGYFAVVGGPKSRFDLLREARLQGIAFVEAVNAEVNGAFWLPAHQRFEAHATSNAVGEGRAIFRILTRFIDRELLPAPPFAAIGSESDTLTIKPFRLAIASMDSLSRFDDWRADLGEATAEVSAEDFNDVAPDRWSRTGPPRFSIETERLGDVLRVDRVQGVFTGIGAVMRLRDAAPGLTLRSAAGYAWSEQAVRGRVVAEYRRGRAQLALRAQRSLDLTNDLRSPYDSGSTISALLGSDNYDYVDRRSVSVQLLRFLGARQQGQLRLEGGWADDRAVVANLARSPLGFGDDFRPNRPVLEGGYLKSSAVLDWRPDVTLEFLRTGLGARLAYERGDGPQLRYERAEGRFTARTNRGPFALGARLDVGITTPDAPPQQLFELGQSQNLPGYGYKQFAGDQAAVLRGLALWRLPYLGAPVRVTQRLWLPPVAPAIAIALQAGWARASTPEAATTVAVLGSAPTGHVRSSGAVTLRFFGGAVGVGVARPLDYPAKWRWIVEFGQRP